MIHKLLFPNQPLHKKKKKKTAELGKFQPKIYTS